MKKAGDSLTNFTKAPSETAMRTLLLLLAASTAVRLLLAVLIDPGIDEAYARAVAERLDWSYFDHPPLTFWIVHAVQALAGPAAPDWLVRLPFVAAFTATGAIAYRLAARLGGAAAGIAAVLTLTLAPFFLVSAGSWIVPDGPMLLFAGLAALVMARILFDEADPGRADRLWLMTGAAFGLALLSKLHAGLIGVGALLFLLGSPRHRGLIATRGPWLAAAVALAVFAPVLVWNAAHGWVSFGFQGGRGVPTGWHPAAGARLVGGQVLYLLPWTFAGLAWALWGGIARAGADTPQRFLASLAWPCVALMTVAPFLSGQGLPHWAMPGWFFAVPLLGARIAAAAAAGSPWPRRAALASAGLLVLAVALVAMAPVVQTRLPATWRPAVDRAFAEALAWRGLDRLLEREGLLPANGFAVATSWRQGGRIAGGLAGRIPVTVFSPDPRGFAFLAPADAQIGRDAVVIGTGPGFARDLALMNGLFERIGPIRDLTLVLPGGAELPIRAASATRLRVPYPWPYGRAGRIAAGHSGP